MSDFAEKTENENTNPEVEGGDEDDNGPAVVSSKN